MHCEQKCFDCVECRMNNILKLILAISLPLLVGFTASYFTITGIGSWYQTIQKPTWNPPNWIFGPVWTTLYVLMGIAFFLVWKSPAPGEIKRPAIILFAIQLVLDFFWSFIFFDQHQTGIAFAEILLMWVMILFTIFAFARISKPAAWLLVPYISWVSFAAILNFTIWKLNS
jgi:translocator protein